MCVCVCVCVCVCACVRVCVRVGDGLSLVEARQCGGQCGGQCGWDRWVGQEVRLGHAGASRDVGLTVKVQDR